MHTFQKKILFILLTYNITQIIHPLQNTIDLSIINKVDHKNSQLNLYLDLIKYNTYEKLEILPYILKNQTGIYLEVGTGGDPIFDLLSKLPETLSATIIASDIDHNILQALPQRHPGLLKYIQNREAGPKLILQQLDGTDMSCFPDNYLSGINASAVIHEIISYAGGLDGLNKFFTESLRTLKDDGLLIYRDPEGVQNKNELVHMKLNNASIRLFSHIFIPKFLDTHASKLAKSGNKSEKYSKDLIQIHFYNKNSNNSMTVSYDEYIKIQTYTIDFSRDYTITLPRGLCREIERHYLTYLHQCNPLVFVKILPSLDSDSYYINYLAHSTQSILEDFIIKNSLDTSNGCISYNTKNAINNTIKKNITTIEFGLRIHFTSVAKQKLLIDLLKKHHFDPNLYIIQTADHDILLDYRIFGILYDYIMEKIFDDNNGPINLEDILHAQWLKREGEETYIYYSDDELIAQIAQLSLSQNKNNESYLLCPISADHNKFIPRLCYEEILKSSININNSSGYPIEIKEGKRIIHFCKMQAQKAYPILLDIIKKAPENYIHLSEFVRNTFQEK